MTQLTTFSLIPDLLYKKWYQLPRFQLGRLLVRSSSKLSFLLLGIGALKTTVAEETPDYLDPNVSIERRIDDLVSRLTLREKVGLLWERAEPIDRLAIPKYDYGNEALHGVTRPGKFTVFPQAIGLAATWNPELIHTTATAISDEARGRWTELEHGVKQTEAFTDLLTFFSPTINLARDPRWGRTAETYGEDPFLTSRIGVAFIKGLQGDHPTYLKVAATPKHYVANNVEKDRFSANTIVSERALREYYLPAFKAAITEANAQSIMSAYNAVNYVPSTANRWLLTDLLRDEWGFDGYVVSDCGASEAVYYAHRYVSTPVDGAAVAIRSGLDLDCNGAGGTGRFMLEYLPLAYRQGKVTMHEIDTAIRRVLRVRFRLGMFDPLENNPYNQISPEVIGSPAHQALALEVARQSIVVMKNTGKTLPLNPNSANERMQISVVGHLADTAVFGDYSGQPLNEAVTPLQGLRNRLESDADVVYVSRSLKVHDFKTVPSEYLHSSNNQRGLAGEYFSNTLLEGPSRNRVDAVVDLHSAENAPDPYLRSGEQSARWTGSIKIPEGSPYRVGVLADDGVRVWLDDELVIDEWQPQSPTVYGSNKELQPGSSHKIRIEWYDAGGGAAMRLLWEPTEDHSGINPFEAEQAAAMDSDVVIAFVGTSIHHEGEGIDKKDLSLPGDQVDMLKAVYQANENLIVVLIAGSQYEIPWIKDHVPALITAWYPGEQGGNAIADVMLGHYNPAGRLPLTFYESVANLPSIHDYEIYNGRTYQYYKGQPHWSFGHGLSYSEYRYTDIEVNVDREKKSVALSVNVSNTGPYDGDEVVQVYAGFPDSSERYPVKKLVAFDRVTIARGATQKVEVHIDKELLSFWSEHSRQWELYSGTIEFQVGASSTDIRLRESVQLQ